MPNAPDLFDAGKKTNELFLLCAVGRLTILKGKFCFCERIRFPLFVRVILKSSLVSFDDCITDGEVFCFYSPSLASPQHVFLNIFKTTLLYAENLI